MITDTLINTYMTNYQGGPSTAALTDGGFVVCWQSYNQNGDGFFDVYAQRYDASGVARGDEFRINTKANHTDNQRIPSIAALADGGFVVSWESYNQDGDGLGVYARHYAANGEAQGGEFLINTVIADNQSNPSVAALADGGRAVTLEFVPNEDRVTPPDAAGFSMVMLTSTPSGDAYTFSELERMFSNAGFSRSTLHPLPPTIEQVVISEK